MAANPTACLATATGNDQAVRACQDAVRDRVRSEYNERNPRFLSIDVDDARGNRDRVVGSMEGRRGETYDYSCTVNTNNGRIRNVDVRRR
jgi:hypothetical protein